MLSPAMPPAPFPRWPKQPRAEQLRAPSTGAPPRTPRAAPSSCHLLEPPFASGPPPHARETNDSHMYPPKKISVIHPMMENPVGSQPSFPHACSSQGLSTPKVELGQASSRGMKGKKGFLSPSEESPPRCQPPQSSHRPLSSTQERCLSSWDGSPSNSLQLGGGCTLGELLGSRSKAPPSPQTPQVPFIVAQVEKRRFLRAGHGLECHVAPGRLQSQPGMNAG